MFGVLKSFYNFTYMKDNLIRTEKDFIGIKEIPSHALYGIHSLRAQENFPDTSQFHVEWYKALATVKRACYSTAKDFIEKAEKKTSIDRLHFSHIKVESINAMISACLEMEKGEHFEHFIVPSISGGAGTSINLNINEIITNRALQLTGLNPGTYSAIDPIEHANIFQSTNDVVPTSLKVAGITLLSQLESSINSLREEVEQLERKHANDLRSAFTQMQEAVPSSFGRLFGTYSDALSRDWWRVSKCFERIKVVNLGGSAIGSGITVPRYFIMEVVRNLQEITGLPVTRGENLFDATNNLDSLVEVHSILKAHAVNLEKMVSDIRLLASDIRVYKDLEIPKQQIGSSIMPGKINPVIPEYVISCAHKIYSNDSLISSLSAQGCLELNAYLPLIGHALIDSLKLLISCNGTIQHKLISGLVVNTSQAAERLFMSPSITTALVPFIGYNKASELAKLMQTKGIDIFKANEELGIHDNAKLREILSTQNLLKEGFTLKDISDINE